MGYAELIQEQLKKMSPEKQAEVYDFVAFVAARSAHGMSGDEESSAAFSTASMTQAMRGRKDDLIGDSLVAESQPRSRERLEHALAEARASWPRKLSVDEVDAEVAKMRAEWDGRI